MVTLWVESNYAATAVMAALGFRPELSLYGCETPEGQKVHGYRVKDCDLQPLCELLQEGGTYHDTNTGGGEEWR